MPTLAGIVLIALTVSTFGLAENSSNSLPQSRDRNFAVQPHGPGTNHLRLDSGLFTNDELRTLAPEEDVCYTMHTLVVAREKDSDRTRIVRQQTCTPSDRFRVNHSVRPPRVVR
jgi:hypothetical protein